ncbi:MAG: Hpt domain-containing protein [Oscillospiraceae bacterium]|jgi:HPt (histidine-containing phosphotransfer) domain-containing protein|nr:Hpt domain-containing protein [Oscillospiraceae bacterium]
MPNYIDMESGLKRVGGSEALFKKLLGKFVDGNYQDQLEALIAEGKTEEATAMAHTIKGVAANLSLMEVNALALQIEQALKNGTEHASLVPQLREVTDATIVEIQKL